MLTYASVGCLTSMEFCGPQREAFSIKHMTWGSRTYRYPFGILLACSLHFACYYGIVSPGTFSSTVARVFYFRPRTNLTMTQILLSHGMGTQILVGAAYSCCKRFRVSLRTKQYVLCFMLATRGRFVQSTPRTTSLGRSSKRRNTNHVLPKEPCLQGDSTPQEIFS